MKEENIPMKKVDVAEVFGIDTKMEVSLLNRRPKEYLNWKHHMYLIMIPLYQFWQDFQRIEGLWCKDTMGQESPPT